MSRCRTRLTPRGDEAQRPKPKAEAKGQSQRPYKDAGVTGVEKRDVAPGARGPERGPRARGLLAGYRLAEGGGRQPTPLPPPLASSLPACYPPYLPPSLPLPLLPSLSSAPNSLSPSLAASLQVASQQEVQAELHEVRRRGGTLRQSLRDMQSEVSRIQGESADVSGASVEAEGELREVHAEQVRAVNEALQGAWEAEAREHRAARRKLDTLRECIRPVQQQLARLAVVAAFWREDLLRSHPALGSYDAGRALFPAPAEAAWDDEATAPENARALYRCVEALVAESARVVAAGGAPAALPAPGDSAMLRAERLALESELERLTGHQSRDVAGADGHPRQDARALSPELLGLRAPPRVSQSPAWPPSPVPRGGTALRGSAAGNRSSVASTMSSVSLRGEQLALPSQQAWEPSTGAAAALRQAWPPQALSAAPPPRRSASGPLYRLSAPAPALAQASATAAASRSLRRSLQALVEGPGTGAAAGTPSPSPAKALSEPSSSTLPTSGTRS